MAGNRNPLVAGGPMRPGQAVFGIHVSADVPTKYHEPMLAGALVPVQIRFVWKDGRGADLYCETRDFSPEELAILISQAVQEGKLSLAFVPGPGALPKPRIVS